MSEQIVQMVTGSGKADQVQRNVNKWRLNLAMFHGLALSPQVLIADIAARKTAALPAPLYEARGILYRFYLSRKRGAR